jgi:hypothetical protein
MNSKKGSDIRSERSLGSHYEQQEVVFKMSKKSSNVSPSQPQLAKTVSIDQPLKAPDHHQSPHLA